MPAFLVVTVLAILLFCLLKAFVVSGCLFPSIQDLIQEINELRLRVGEMDNERLQYEKKLKTTKVSEAEGRGREGCKSGFRNSLFSLILACTLQNPEHSQVLGFHGFSLGSSGYSQFSCCG